MMKQGDQVMDFLYCARAKFEEATLSGSFFSFVIESRSRASISYKSLDVDLDFGLAEISSSA